MEQKTYGKSSLSAAPSQGLRRCLNILERHQEEDDLLYTLADGVQGFADLIADGVLGKAERLRYRNSNMDDLREHKKLALRQAA